MIPIFSRAEFRVHLAAGALVACEVRRHWGRPVVARKKRFEFKKGERGVAMNGLAAWIARGSSRRSIMWIIGPSEARYFVLPWSATLNDRREREASAEARFQQVFEQDPRSVAFYFAPLSEDNGQLVSCVPMSLQSELTDFAGRAGCEFAGIKPSIPMVWDRFRGVVESERRRISGHFLDRLDFRSLVPNPWQALNGVRRARYS